MLECKRILIIDNSDTTRTYLRNVLAPLEAGVDGAATGREGLNKCSGVHYDLVLLELLLPDIDGIQVLEQIRAKNTTSAVVVLTEHGSIKSAVAATQLGGDGYLQKQDVTATGSDHSEFLHTLEQALQRRAAQASPKPPESRAEFHSAVARSANTIMAATDALIKSDTGQLTAGQTELITIVQQAARKLLGMPDAGGEALTRRMAAEPIAGQERAATGELERPASAPKQTGPLDVSRDPEYRRLFFKESHNHVRTLQNIFRSLYAAPQDQQLVTAAHRASHTLRGNASTMQHSVIYDLAAQMEHTLKQADDGTLALTQTDVRRLAQLLERIARALTTERQDSSA